MLWIIINNSRVTIKIFRGRGGKELRQPSHHLQVNTAKYVSYLLQVSMIRYEFFLFENRNFILELFTRIFFN